MEKIKVAFLDRDGVINKDYGYVHSWDNFKFCDKAIDGMKNLINLEFKIIIITNQSGIARGLFTESDYQILTKKMVDYLFIKGIRITEVFHCPHHPLYSDLIDRNCNCRKPKPGLFLKAQEKFNINIKDSISIGDNSRDLIASKLIGIEKRYLISSQDESLKNDLFEASFKSLYDCSEFIKKGKYD